MLYPTIWKDFEIIISDNGARAVTLDLKVEIKDIKNYEFATHSLSFLYNQGNITMNLIFDGNPISTTIISKVKDFNGKIYGEYLSLDLTKWKKYKKNVPEYKIKKYKDTFNMFYNNGMLVLTKQELGIKLSDLAIREKSSYGFRNPFGYTAVQETNLKFDESRTNITDDDQNEYKKYVSIIKEIYG